MSYRWHEEYPERYQVEMTLLRQGVAGRFQLLEVYPAVQAKLDLANGQRLAIDGAVFAAGQLHYGEGQVHQVLLEYPATYPDEPVAIYPVADIQLQGNMLVCRSINFGKGQQYGDGKMCLFAKHTWDADLHDGAYALTRAARWLTFATSATGFPASEIVEENVPVLPPAGTVVFPFAVDVPAGSPGGHGRLLPVGPNLYTLLEFSEASPTPTSLHTRQVQGRRWQASPSFLNPAGQPGVEVHWQRLDGISFPQAVATRIGLVQQRLAADGGILQASLAAGAELFFGFYLGQEEQWFMLRVRPNGNGGGAIEFFITRHLESELYLRVQDIFEPAILATKTVTIVGLGALGSEVACELARNGVGRFHLFDPELMDLGNSVRSAADLSTIGQHKVHAVRNLMLNRNPNVQCEVYPQLVGDVISAFERAAAASDIVIVLTAENSVDFPTNRLNLKRLRKPFLYARASKGALTGVVQLVEPGISACLRCLVRHPESDLPVSRLDTAHMAALKTVQLGCAAPSFPGAGVDTREIALQTSRVALQRLLTELPQPFYPALPGYQFRWHGPAGSAEHAPFAWEILHLGPHPDCSVCRTAVTSPT
ncbi:ThiF family adenylyltransferase [Hymenobacter metallicola]|uniref:ThiF family adenylyltransferase n=2 Tax=Hymenobacter metallicola TaxID=2563114 RepID=A0A4Z0PWR4_9BACT|nr:ThiF family adenylyltransferase [Hymenobacter metallicola]